MIEHLSTHHSIEERHVFPHLARKMAIFSSSPAQLLVKQHEEIHNGMDKLEKYVKECLSGVRDLRMEEVKNIMDEFGGVLWDHLDREVYELGAERMRKFWSLGEMREMPF